MIEGDIMRITVGMLKGGASRTTSSVYLALALHNKTGEKVLLVDGDPANGTAYEWVEDAGERWPEGVGVESVPAPSLAKRVPGLVSKGGYEHLVIDTGNSAEAIVGGLMVTDQLLVPMAPSGTEAARFMATLQAAAQVAAGKRIDVSILLTRTVHHTRTRANAIEALEAMSGQLGVQVLETEVPFRQRFAASYGSVPADVSPYDAVLIELQAIEEGK